MNAEQVAEAHQMVEEARSAAEQAQQLLSKAEARAESAEEAKIELSLKLAELAAQHESAGDLSGMPTKKASEAELDGDSMQKRYAAASAPCHICICNPQWCVALFLTLEHLAAPGHVVTKKRLPIHGTSCFDHP